MRSTKSANSKLFKDFCNEAEMENNSQIVGFILSSSLTLAAKIFLSATFLYPACGQATMRHLKNW